MEEKRLAVVSIIVEDGERVAEVNALLHDYATYILARLGVPISEREVSVICIVMDAPGDITSALSGKLGMIKGVSTKTTVSKLK